MKSRITLTIASLILIVGFSACVQDNVDSVIKHYSDDEYAALTQILDLPQDPLDYSLQIPHTLGGNSFVAPIDNDMATLGRVLFYDKRLSANNTTSCGSCHEAEKAFADGRALSEGFDGEETPRNSLALGSVVNFQSSYGGGNSFAGFGAGFFWDDRAATVAEQSEETLQNPIEMGMDIEILGEKLLKEDYYKILFRKAFKDAHDIRPMKDQVLDALAVFVNSIASFESDFDEGLLNHHNPNASFSNFTPAENLGKELFMENCSSCHGEKVSTTVRALANNGLDMVYEDQGVGARTNNSSDNGVFKVPMLRNVALTGPYMHDGRFETLEEVVEHYNSGIQNHPNLDHELKSGNAAKKLNLSEDEKAALVAFLHTLTDVESLVQEKYLDPFK